MKAAVCLRYGSPEQVEIRDVPNPEPKPHEVLIRVQATTVTSGDWRIRSLTIPLGMKTLLRLALGWNGPRQPILGSECVGTIQAVGSQVRLFEVGQPVIAFHGASMGCHAELKIMAEKGALIPRPDGLSDQEAAAFSFGGTTALHFLRDKAGIQSGQRILIIGASGSVGSAAIQIARHFGAHVTTLTSAANTNLAEQLGAHQTYDYKSHDFTRASDRYDLIMDAVNATTFSQARPILNPGGRLLMVAADLGPMIRSLFPMGDRRSICSVAPERRADLEFLAQLATAGGYRPVIDSTFQLADIQSAHRRVESGRKRGNVVVQITAGEN